MDWKIEQANKQRSNMCEKYVIGYWVSERKRQKFNWTEFHNVCESKGFSLKRIDVNLDLEAQGPFHVFLHKLTDMLAHAESGNRNAEAIISRIKQYLYDHPEIIVIDPLNNIRNLSNRYRTYQLIEDGFRDKQKDIFTPRFVEIKSKNTAECISLLRKAGIRFPFVCKQLIAHGSSEAHKMMVIFNQKGLKDCQPHSVAQEFVNHNAVVYKIFIVGDHYHVVERPSFKNFYDEDCTALDTIFFNSHDISKSGSRSKWTILSETDIPYTVKPMYETFETIVKRITDIFGLVLVGVDVVIENHTRRYAIIDVNVFPGYDGYPNFFECLTDHIRQLIKQRDSKKHHTINGLRRENLIRQDE